MNDNEFELFRDRVFDYAADQPMTKCPRCYGSGRRPGSTSSGEFTQVRCSLCVGKGQVTEEANEQYLKRAIFP